jgi:hypothetical protein
MFDRNRCADRGQSTIWVSCHPEAESTSWAVEKTPVKMEDILTAVSTIHQHSARRRLGQKQGFDAKKWQR